MSAGWMHIGRDVPSGDKLARAWVNMRRHAARTKRADAKAQTKLNDAVAGCRASLSLPPVCVCAARSCTRHILERTYLKVAATKRARAARDGEEGGMMTHKGRAKRDLDWCATADLEGVRERDIPGYLRALSSQYYFEMGTDPPSVGELLRARLNMEKYAARARRADAAAQTPRLLAIAAVLASAGWLLWQVNRLLT